MKFNYEKSIILELLKSIDFKLGKSLELILFS